jgi:hypothetical protein
MTQLDPSAAIAGQEPLARALFDALHSQTHDGIGITRASYGPGEGAARDIMAGAADNLTMEVEDDAAGNVYMTLPGADRSALPVVWPRVAISMVRLVSSPDLSLAPDCATLESSRRAISG